MSYETKIFNVRLLHQVM